MTIYDAAGFSPAAGKAFDTEEVRIKTLFKLFLKTIIYLIFSSMRCCLSKLLTVIYSNWIEVQIPTCEMTSSQFYTLISLFTNDLTD